jgi:hypothetical protein
MSGFKAHRGELGHRLERLQALGRCGLSRRIVEVVIEAPSMEGPAQKALKQDSGVSVPAVAKGGRGPASATTGSG